MKKKKNNRKVDTDVEKPKRFIMKFEFTDGVVFPKEMELIKECFKGVECFDPKEFKIEEGKLIVEGNLDWNKYSENLSENEEDTVTWFDILRYRVYQIFDSNSIEYGDFWTIKKWDGIRRLGFLNMKLKFHYWLKYLGELVSE